MLRDQVNNALAHINQFVKADTLGDRLESVLMGLSSYTFYKRHGVILTPNEQEKNKEVVEALHSIILRDMVPIAKVLMSGSFHNFFTVEPTEDRRVALTQFWIQVEAALAGLHFLRAMKLTTRQEAVILHYASVRTLMAIAGEFEPLKAEAREALNNFMYVPNCPFDNQYGDTLSMIVEN